MNLRPDEKDLARALLESGRLERPELLEALSLLKRSRARGGEQTLHDILLELDLVTRRDLEAHRPAGSGEGWRAYRSSDSSLFLESYERRRRRSGRSPRRPTERPVSGASGFVLDDSESVAPVSPEIDDQTLTMDTHAAARLAIKRVKSRERAPGRRESPAHGAAQGSAGQGGEGLSPGALIGAFAVVGIAFLAFVWSRPGSEPRAPSAPSAVVRESPLERSEGSQGLRQQRFDERAAEGVEREAAGDYAGALMAWDRALEAAREHSEDYRLAESGARRARRLVDLEGRFDVVFIRVETLLTEGRDAEALSRLEQLGSELGALSETPLAKRLAVKLEVVAGRIPAPQPERGVAAMERPVEPPAPEAPRSEATVIEPARRRARFAKLAQKGSEAVEQLVKRIAEAKSAARARVEREAKRVRDLTRKRPMTFELKSGYVVPDGVVTRYDEGGFAVSSRGAEIAFGWDMADRSAAYRVRKLAAGADPESLLGLGRFCVERRLFESAHRAFGRAVKLAPELANRVPDVEDLEQQSEVFRGAFRRLGAELVTVSYDFSKSNQIKDFKVDGVAAIRRGKLEVEGSKVSVVMLRDLVFERRARVAVEPSTAEGDALIAVGFGSASVRGQRRGVLVAYRPKARALALLNWRDGGTSTLVKPQVLKATPKRISLELTGRLLRVRADRRVVMTARWPEEDSRVRAVTGCLSKLKSKVRIKSMEVSGQVGRTWLRKTFGAADDRLRAALAVSCELSVFARGGKRPRRSRTLSAEDSFGLKAMQKEQRKRYRAARTQLGKDKVRGFLDAFAVIQELATAYPGCGALHYQLARAQKRLGRSRAALESLARAIERCPHFHEAMALRAELLLSLGRNEEALTDVDMALAERPDVRFARYLRARALFLLGRFEAALADAELASALDPYDELARTLRRNVSWVLAGPPWERRYRHESANFIVETDIASDKARFYAGHLEAIRSFYLEQFGGVGFTSGDKARVLIFDTREGFQSYAKLTTDDRVESFLGYFHPRFRQLLLFEGRGDVSGDETLRVLYHEGFHQFCHSLIPKMPFWLSEGLAEYYAGSRVESGEVTARGLLHEGRVRDLRRHLKDRRLLGFRKLMLESPTEFYSGPVSVKYAQAWSMVHFFMQGAEGRYRPVLIEYLEQLRQGASASEAFDRSFAKLDLEASKAELLRYIGGWR